MNIWRYVKTVLIYSFVVIFSVWTLLPVYWTYVTSFKPLEDVVNRPPIIFPFQPTLDNYAQAIKGGALRALLNSLTVASATTAISIVLGIMAGYSFARFRVGGKRLPSWVLSIKMLPPVVFAVPLFLIMRFLALTDTLFAIVLAHLIIDLPLAIWLLRGYFLDVPLEIEESAMIEGCSRFGVLKKITLPLTLHGILATAFLCFLFSWNEYLFAIILSVKVTTLSTLVRGMWGSHASMATITVLSTVPTIAFATIMYKYLARGFTLGFAR